jgi:hypothetical protein
VSLSILGDPRLEVILPRVDEELAEHVREKGCPFCRGRLDRARYPRKPRSLGEFGAGWNRRESFCCAEEGCRRRRTPPSVRFLGRRVYVGVVVVLVSVLVQGLTARRLRALRKSLGVEIDPRTLERWRRWWREAFPASAFWRAARARFLPPVEETDLPRSLLARFAADTLEGLVSALRWLAPMSIPSPSP